MGHIYVFNLLPSHVFTLLHFSLISSTIFESLNNDDSKESDKHNNNNGGRKRNSNNNKTRHGLT